jgi:outer membrane lipoprotein SlyB
MRRTVAVLAASLCALTLSGCAQLSQSEATWCAYHEDLVRQVAREMGTEDEIEWRRTAGIEHYRYDSAFAAACRAALESDPAFP